MPFGERARLSVLLPVLNGRRLRLADGVGQHLRIVLGGEVGRGPQPRGRQVAGRDWYVFIVGKVEEGTVSDIRVAAAAASAGSGLQWTMGQQNAAATNAYRDARQRFRLQGSAAAIAFPLEEDVFEIQTSDRSITVTERLSLAG